jgi:hypothetical protein
MLDSCWSVAVPPMGLVFYLEAPLWSLLDSSSLGGSSSGEVLDPVGSGIGLRIGVAFLTWGVALKILLPSMVLCGLDTTLRSAVL